MSTETRIETRHIDAFDLELELEIVSSSVDADPDPDTVREEPTHKPLDEYESASERARDVHIRDLDLPPRWDGHAPVPTMYVGTGGMQGMIVCRHCGKTAETRELLLATGECPD